MGRKICRIDSRGQDIFMIFTELELKGVFTIELEKMEDDRGFFARIWDKKEFEKYNLNSKLVQCSISFNKKKGTLRGLHYQTSPFEEAKLVRCTSGSIFDVIVDLRQKSKTFRQWIGVELSDKNYKMLYIPEGFAHGFQTLENDTEVFYQMTQSYMPEYAQGLRWNDPVLAISWPLKNPIISKRDSGWQLIT